VVLAIRAVWLVCYKKNTWAFMTKKLFLILQKIHIMQSSTFPHLEVLVLDYWNGFFEQKMNVFWGAEPSETNAIYIMGHPPHIQLHCSPDLKDTNVGHFVEHWWWVVPIVGATNCRVQGYPSTKTSSQSSTPGDQISFDINQCPIL